MSTEAYTPAPYRHAHTPYRRAGRSGLLLPPISLGFWQNFGENRDPLTLRTIVRRAFDRGVTHFDLANNYGPPPGSAETDRKSTRLNSSHVAIAYAVFGL